MLINRINKNLKNKIGTIMLVFVISLGAIVGYGCQQKRINNLQQQLEMKLDKDNKDKGMYSTTIDTQTIKSKFNELNSYKVFDGTTILKHKYEYQRDAWLGLKSKATLVANAKCYYSYEVDLKDAIVTVDHDTNTINIKLPKARLNKDSVHILNNTFKEVEKESHNNILMNDKDGEKVMRYFIESFNTSAIDKIEEYYEMGVMRDKLEDYSKREVLNLVNTLGLNKININIEIK